MLTRKKSIKSRSRRARRKRSKFITPDLVLVAGKLMRHVSSPDNPLSAAERLRGEFAQMEDGHDAEVRQFLQRAYFVAAQFRWRLGDFERFQVHPFWKQSGMKPNDPATSKWLLYLIMEATTPNLRQLADKYAAILDGLKQDQVEIDAVAARIQELGGIDAAYEAMQVRKRGDANKVQVCDKEQADPGDAHDAEVGDDAVGRTGGPALKTSRKSHKPPAKLVV